MRLDVSLSPAFLLEIFVAFRLVLHLASLDVAAGELSHCPLTLNWYHCPMTPIDLPPKLLEKDVDALSALLPQDFELVRESIVLLLTMTSDVGGTRIPLFTLEIAPFHKRDFSGTIFAEFLVDLSHSLIRGYEAMRASPNDIENRILRLLGEPIDQAMTRHVKHREFHVRVRTIHTAIEEKWYSVNLSS